MDNFSGVNQPPSGGGDYPFLNPPDSLRWLIGDLFIAYEDRATGVPFKLPLRIAWMYGFGSEPVVAPDNVPGPTHDRDLLVVDDDGDTVFDSTQPSVTYQSNQWIAGSDDRLVLQWKDATTDVVVRMTWVATPPQHDPTRTLPTHIVPTPPVAIDARTYLRLPRRVTSLLVGVDELTSTGLTIAEGNNVRLTAVPPTTLEDGGRRRSQIRIRMNPGDGLGRVNDCADRVTPIRRIGGASANAGGWFTFEATDCTRLQRPTAPVLGTNPRQVQFAFTGRTESEARASLMLNEDCAPCCDCDDFSRVYRGIRSVFGQYLGIGERAQATRDQHEANIIRWNEARACRLEHRLRVLAAGEPRRGLYVGGVLCNTYEGCISPLMLRITLQHFRDDVELPPLSTPTTLAIRCREVRRSGTDTNYEERLAVLAGPAPVFDLLFDSATPQSRSYFRSRFKIIHALDGDQIRVTLTAHFNAVTDPAIGQAMPTPPTLDDSELPDGVVALWTGRPLPYPVKLVTQMTTQVGPLQGCGTCG